ncbi:MAG: 50S ribosomal protein L17 [Planctomycetota bacterium]|nr:50S ribosomal protein L17 [Planctomycetota bacterium]
MRHRVAGRKLTRDTQHRIALRRNLVRALLINGRITTTMAKAKAVRPYVEKLVTRAKKAAALKSSSSEGDRAAYVHQVRLLAREVPDRKLLSLLVDVVGPMVQDRPGGYTRILRDARNSLGDNAPRAIFEFVDRVEEPEEDEPKGKKKKK